MAHTTKRTLSETLKKILQEKSLDKVTVVDIVEASAINRQTFYYHFKDKYDLINWIYSTEFISNIQDKIYDSEWDFIEDTCTYFYDNRDFYKKALLIEGQNSFFEYFRDVLKAIVNEYLRSLFMECKDSEFYTTFLTDAFITSIVRWLTDRNCMPAEEYVTLLKSCIEDFAKVTVKKLK